MKKEVILTAPNYMEVRGRSFPVSDFVMDHCSAPLVAADRKGKMSGEIFLRTPGKEAGTFQVYGWLDGKPQQFPCSVEAQRFAALRWEKPQTNHLGIRRYHGKNCIAFEDKLLWYPHTRKDEELSAILTVEHQKEMRAKESDLSFFGAFQVPGAYNAAKQEYESKQVPCYLYKNEELVAYSQNAMGECWYDVQPVYASREFGGDLQQSEITLFGALGQLENCPEGTPWEQTALGKFANKEYFIDLFMTQDYEERLEHIREENKLKQTQTFAKKGLKEKTTGQEM